MMFEVAWRARARGRRECRIVCVCTVSELTHTRCGKGGANAQLNRRSQLGVVVVVVVAGNNAHRNTMNVV